MESACEFDWGLFFTGIQTTVAVLVAGKAWVGFNQWKKELRGKDQYEMAKRILEALIPLRSAFEAAYPIHLLELEQDAYEYVERRKSREKLSLEDERELYNHVLAERGYEKHFLALHEAVKRAEHEARLGQFVLGQDIIPDIRDIFLEFVSHDRAMREHIVQLGRHPKKYPEDEGSQGVTAPGMPEELRERLDKRFTALEDKLMKFSK